MKIHSIFRTLASVFVASVVIMLTACEDPPPQLDVATALDSIEIPAESGWEGTTWSGSKLKASLTVKPASNVSRLYIVPTSTGDVEQVVRVIDGDEEVEGESGESFEIADLGTTKRTVQVIVSEDGKQDRTYTIKITKQGLSSSANVILSQAKVVDGAGADWEDSDWAKKVKLTLSDHEWDEDELNDLGYDGIFLWFDFTDSGTISSTSATYYSLTDGVASTEPDSIAGIEIDSTDAKVLTITFGGNSDTCLARAKLSTGNATKAEIANATTADSIGTITNPATNNLPLIALGALTGGSPNPSP